MTDKQKERKTSLLSYIYRNVEGQTKYENIYENIIDDMIFLETQLEYLKKLPFIRVDKNNPEKQKSTPAHRQYKELLNSYILILKMFSKNDEDVEVESPLRTWMNQHVKSSD